MTSPATLRDQGIAQRENAADPRLLVMIDAKIFDAKHKAVA